MSKADKETAKTPDGFIRVSDQLALFVRENKTTIIGIVSIMIILALGKVALDFYTERRNLQVEESLFYMEESLDNTFKKIKDKKSKKIFKEEALSLVKRYENQVRENSGVPVAAAHALRITNLYKIYDMPDEALSLLKEISSHLSSSNVAWGLVHLKRAVLLMDSGRENEALVGFDKILKNKMQSYLHPQALLQKALVYSKKRDNSKAQALFEKIRDDYPRTLEDQAARSYLKLLKLNQWRKPSSSFTPPTGKTTGSPEIKAGNILVYKYDGSLQCGHKKPISLKVMVKDLKQIKIYSQMNKSDGLMRIQVCGSPTGMANIYEISETDFARAKVLGFKTWNF